MLKLALWLLVLVVCWPVAILALLLYIVGCVALARLK